MKVLYEQLKNNEVEFSFRDKLIEVLDINKVRTTKDIVRFEFLVKGYILIKLLLFLK
jgi:hypothetical protein